MSMAALALMALGASETAAAPQMIALIATNGPVTLQCARGECGAEFTSICLERFRPSPLPGTAYYLHDPESLTVEGVRSDGTVVALDAWELVAIASERGHSAVRLSVPWTVLREYGIASVRMSVAGNATLVPVPETGDRAAHTEADIALVAGPLRSAASLIIANGGERIAAARMALRLVNSLPRLGRATGPERDAALQFTASLAGSDGYGLVREGFDRCYANTRASLMSLRQCLGSAHDQFIGELNTRYWRAVEGGM